jgi:hypothetical protein
MSLEDTEQEQAYDFAVRCRLQPRADAGEVCAVSALCALWVGCTREKRQQVHYASVGMTKGKVALR